MPVLTGPVQPQFPPPGLNHLQGERSLYLQQHARNPLDWYPWGAEALERAQSECRLILLSIGYSSCHWCHVMEHEVFERQDVADYMNARFVCIKVDREERPDLDAVYMEAAQLLTGRGGWPLNLWLTPELQPVYAATYLPQAAFLDISQQLAELWTSSPQRLREAGAQLAAALNTAQGQALPGELDQSIFDNAAQQFRRRIDPQWGGLTGEVKFPLPAVWEFLLHYWQRHGGEPLEAALRLTLDRMADGGLYDHLAGGFHRYSTDRQWLVPHFEKMLYDNAQLAGLYCDAGRALGEPRYAAVARDVLDCLLREMSAPDGGFYASFDADSGAGEGSYYVWSQAELQEIAGADGPALAEALGVMDKPNFADHHGTVSGSILTRRVSDAQGLFEKYRPSLLAARSERAAPALDRKIVTAWNGMAISACAKGYLAYGDQRYLKQASATADFLWRVHRQAQGRLCRASNAGVPVADGILDDYAQLAQGLLDLHEASGDTRHLQQALELIAYARQHFANPDGGFFLTADAAGLPFARRMELHDSVEPSGNSALCRVMLKAAALTGDEGLSQAAGQQLSLFAGVIQRNALGMPNWLTTALLHLVYYTVVIAGEPDAADTRRLAEVCRASIPLNAVVIGVPAPGVEPSRLKLQPLLMGKVAINGRATAYVCEHGTCQSPVHDPADLRQLLAQGTEASPTA